MDEAYRRLQQAPNQAQLRVMRAAVAVLAQRSAIKEVKRQFRAQGFKPQRMTHREIVAAANDYLAKHRTELVNEASAGHPITSDFGSQNGVCHDQAGSALRPRQH
jgi:hypothetical protein